jgi:ATP-dependent DNA ligase
MAPEGDSWIHEVKIDGYRTAARIERGQVAMGSRRRFREATLREPQNSESG